VERCWHGKFTGAGQCPEEGRYGSPEYRPTGENPRLNATLGFMRAACWCLAHKHPDDRLLGPGAAEQSGGGTQPPGSGLTP
jgi:hypothetical protein